MPDSTQPRERGLGHLKDLVRDAITLATGGLHANSADPLVSHEEFASFAHAVVLLNEVRTLLNAAPEFVVVDGSARMMG